ncbi:MAG: hypothetical protein ABI691_01620 [Ginsengibacter sp.]
MRKKNPYLRAMAISIFVLLISFYNFTRLSNSDCIRAIHVVTLLVCGMAIGAFLANLIGYVRNK